MLMFLFFLVGQRRTQAGIYLIVGIFRFLVLREYIELASRDSS